MPNHSKNDPQTILFKIEDKVQYRSNLRPISGQPNMRGIIGTVKRVDDGRRKGNGVVVYILWPDGTGEHQGVNPNLFETVANHVIKATPEA